MTNTTRVAPALTADDWSEFAASDEDSSLDFGRVAIWKHETCVHVADPGDDLDYTDEPGAKVEKSADGGTAVFLPSIAIADGSYPATLAEPELRHAVAALCLHGQPFGFTREDLKALSRCADNAERWASARMYDSEDHDAHKRTRTIIQRIEALLPPE